MTSKPSYEELERRIQELEKAEFEHNLTEDYLRKIFDNTQDAIFIHDLEGKILDVNDKMCRIYGLTKEEALNVSIEDISSSRMSMKVLLDRWQKALNGEKLLFEWEARRPKDEIVFSAEVSIQMVSFHAKNNIIANVRDISERKSVEQALRESEDRFRAIVEGAPDAVFVQTESKFAYLNPQALQLFGAQNRDELLGQPVFDRFHPDFHDKARERISRLNEQRQPVLINFELKFLRLDGNEVWVETTGQPIVYQGKNGALVFVRDVTVRKQAEAEKEQLQAQLLQAQKMESVGRLAGGVAHDFNNMLGVILGYTEMALDEIDPSTPLYASLHGVRLAAERSAALTRQLLAFARKQTMAPKVIDLNETVEGMLNMLRRLIGEDINLLWQPGRNLQPVKMDPSQIDQLLANLCVNARDAIAGVGKVTIETDVRTFDEEYCTDHLGTLPGEYVLLEVSDDGCGMDKKTLSHIFEPFFTTKEQGKGTGLGLASIYGIVRQNNGFINVYSEPDQGTTFKIYLPVYAATSTGVAEKAHDLPAEHGNETILLVEDESAILNMTTTMLERLGYTVVAAATPGEAIRLAHEYRGRIDLLMTDVVMPEMNGRQLAGNLLSNYPDLKRLFMSGYTANVIAHHGVLDEGVHFIQKPFSKKELGRKLREALEV